MATRPGKPSISSRMRASYFTVPTMPTFSPKYRSSPRMSFSIAMAFSCNSFSRGQHGAPLLAGQRLDVHRLEEVDTHHLGDAPRISAVASCSAAAPSERLSCAGSRYRSPGGWPWRDLR